MLNLSRNREGALRLVTTNFDRTFHAAARRIRQPFPEYAAPMLPIPKTSRWNDLMLFRLICSADRAAQIHNIYTALITNQDDKAEISGLSSSLALFGMRKLSQRVFGLFKKSYITTGRNFFKDVENESKESFIGGYLQSNLVLGHDQIQAAYSTVKSFVIYQLANRFQAEGSGIGCGHYDEVGAKDQHGIASKMNDYIFNICFNPEVSASNSGYFLDYCLSHLSDPTYSNNDSDSYVATTKGLIDCFDQDRLATFWKAHKEKICEFAQNNLEREVFTANYSTSYQNDLPMVFDKLDELTENSNTSQNL